MDWKDQYSENEYTTKAIYRFSTIPIKQPMVFFQKTRTNNFIIYMEIQKNSKSQCDLEKEEWNWRNQPA